ncbi:MAG TPA: tRNA pseudouridine(38-40) synthase TruA [Rhodocyclaceae bacterium]|nr:tRNA pseudouridine(38-40) synthase TruA [Rhodocyclaceae bacterium]
MRIALGVEYDGSSFAGWQSQSHGNTVQDVLERALAAVADGPVRVACAGRTDAGVHATAQVAHFDTEAVRPESAWVRGVNTHLPPAVAVTWARQVDAEFHARFSASARHYRYLLLNRPVRPALAAGRVGWFHRPLDEALMAEASALLLGEHDFSAFRAAECQAKSPVKTLARAAVARQGELLVFDFSANAFLHHMVRNIVGSLVHVGKGARPVAWLAEVLASRDRSRAAPTFDAAGLYFAGVDYDSRWRLPQGGRIMMLPTVTAN